MGLRNVDKKMPVLIVDDFATLRKIVKGCLQQIGFENVTEVEDGKEALEKLQSGEFKLVISDWNMPQMMGVELLRAVRSDEKLKSVPFLMITAEAQTENIREATKEASVSTYIVKPFTTEGLQEKLEAIFSKK